MHNATTKSMIWLGVAAATAGMYVLFGIWGAILIGVGSAWQLTR